MRTLLGLVLALAVLLVPSAAVAADTSRPGVVRYPDDGVEIWRHGGDVSKLDETTAGFRRFVRHRLDVLWRQNGARPACAHSSLVIVKVFDARKYALFGAGNFAHGGDPARCNGGGYVAIAARWNGRWREVVAGQEAPSCDELHRYAVPRTVAPDVCIDDDGDQVPYQPAA